MTRAPAAHRAGAAPRNARGAVTLPREGDAELRVGQHTVAVTNLHKPFWPALGLTKADLLQYYMDMAEVLVPHLRGRAMVMKRYPDGAAGKWFFMKRTPSPHPDWLNLCSIEHGSGSVIDFPMIDTAAALLWVANLGCIDLNPWYSRCDDVDRPDFLHFDLDPVPDATFDTVCEVGLLVHEALAALGMHALAKTSGSKGMHVYVAIARGPTQKDVWRFAKSFAQVMASRHPKLITAEYKIARRPAGRVLVDYNQNAWGRTLASVYSPRPTPKATVSTPVTWGEVERGIAMSDFRIDTVVSRVRTLGDLWKPLLVSRGRFNLEALL